MASTPAVKRARRSLIFLLVIIVGLAGLITIGVTTKSENASWTPKLALDLQGGTQILLAGELPDGQAVSGEQLDQAVSIIRQRVDAAGVSEAEITTQGSQHISVSIPGKADQATLQRIEASAKLDFRPVLQVAVGVTAEDLAKQEGSDGAAASPDGADAATAQEDTTKSDAKSSDAAKSDSADAKSAATDAQTDAADTGDLDPSPLPEGAGDTAWITPALQQKFTDFSCLSDAALDTRDAAADRPLITCDDSGMKYILGPVELKGDVITDATAQAETTQTGATTGGWVVQIIMDSEGASTFGKISQRKRRRSSSLILARSFAGLGIGAARAIDRLSRWSRCGDVCPARSVFPQFCIRLWIDMPLGTGRAWG